MGTDYRLRENRRAAFHDFYEFHLRYRAHPGCVYYVMPWLREHFAWTDEETLWFAFLNGNTQNPITSLLLHQRAPTPASAPAMLDWYQANYGRLAFDTDRRYHKKALAAAVGGYTGLVRHNGTQARLWAGAAGDGWPSLWATATSIPTFGRLSAWSYLEYLRIAGIPVECDTLMLDDIPGSRSHRNGLAIVNGLDRYDWHASNPAFPGAYPADVIETLKIEGAVLITEARIRAAGQPWEGDVSYLSLESTLCTYKGWHRMNRRYPNVYNDMLYYRIRGAAQAFAGSIEDLEAVGLFWQARQDCLPPHLRLEDVPNDPGLVPLKQNHYRLTGEVPMLGHDYPDYWSDFDEGVRTGAYGIRVD